MYPFLAIFKDFTYILDTFPTSNFELFVKFPEQLFFVTHINGYFCNCKFDAYFYRTTFVFKISKTTLILQKLHIILFEKI